MNRLNGIMRSEAWTWLKHKLVPVERQIILRAHGHVRFMTLSRRVQVGMAIAVLLAGGWVGFASLNFFEREIVILGKDAELARSRKAYRDVMGELEGARARLAETARSLEQNHEQLAALLNQNGALRTDLDEASKKVDQPKAPGAVAEDRTRRPVTGPGSEHAALQATQQKHEELMRERRRLDERVESLRQRLARLQSAQEGLLNRLAENTEASIAHVKDMISRAGLNVNQMLARLEKEGAGKGGPFVPAGNEESEDGEFTGSVAALYTEMDMWERLQAVLRQLPLASPVDNYYIASGYGSRSDPINGEPAKHLGVDLSGRMLSPVHAGAPGKVSFAGEEGRYGKLVIIDHGLGITTRYGHLQAVLVKEGEEVDYRQKIGLLGSSGRSTGPHLHYEIRVDGKAHNPVKFLRAGRYVFKG